MPRFSSLVLGTRATRPITFPHNGADVPLAVRPLNGTEEGEVLAAARAYAVARGLAAPKDGDRLYDLALMAHTNAVGCVDVEDTAHAYFDGGAQQILDALDLDRITLLYEAQQAWQDECGARPAKMGMGEWLAKVVECAEAAEGEDPLGRMRPSLRASWARTTASQLLSSLQRRSESGSTSVSAVSPS